MITTCGILLINKHSQILTVKATNSNNWSIPKGIIHKNETIFDCADRECFEETNLKMKDLFLTNRILSYNAETILYYKQSKVRKQLIALGFRLLDDIPDIELKCNSFIDGTKTLEVSEIKWNNLGFCLDNLHYTQVMYLKRIIEMDKAG